MHLLTLSFQVSNLIVNVNNQLTAHFVRKQPIANFDNQLIVKDVTQIVTSYFTKVLRFYSAAFVLFHGVVIRASASQSVDLGFNPLVDLYQKTLKNGIYSFPA